MPLIVTTTFAQQPSATHQGSARTPLGPILCLTLCDTTEGWYQDGGRTQNLIERCQYHTFIFKKINSRTLFISKKLVGVNKPEQFLDFTKSFDGFTNCKLLSKSHFCPI